MTAIKYFALTLMASLLLAFSPAAAKAEPYRIVAVGDSLMAGFGLPPGETFPEKLQAALKAKGYDVTIDNAGASGDTSSGGLSRLDWSVPEGTRLVILELGANDMLRGIEPALTEKNLDAMISRLKARGVQVILAGMRAAPNLGPDYQKAFDGIYKLLADRHGVTLYPFFIDGVAAQKALLQDDGMHPNGEGVGRMVERFLPVIEPLLAAATTASDTQQGAAR
ncbi:arylesterase [Mesorhizobium sp. SP-1A]|uniref:arylesterase n=1 Tax=Mesorhizobium sp. SP-1A TaxID=3077840 RepID=UPI0028F6EBBF|nr:arylesterase [Mesorhizobium sp. SP-1A]